MNRRSTRLLIVFVLLVGSITLSASNAFATGGERGSASRQTWKAVVIAGADVDNAHWEAEDMAALLQSYGIDVSLFISCNKDNASHEGSGWSLVREALPTADIVYYTGHGGGQDGHYTDGQFWGFGLDHDESWSEKHGIISQDIITADVDFKPNALVIMHHACWAAGTTIDDPESGVVYNTAKQRVDAYARTFLTRNEANAYLAYNVWQDHRVLTEFFFKGKTLSDSIKGYYENYGAPNDVKYASNYTYNNGLQTYVTGDNADGVGNPMWNMACVSSASCKVTDILPGFQIPDDPPPDGVTELSPTNGDLSQNFNEFILLQNPNNEAVNVETYLSTAKNQNFVIRKTIQPNSRDTIWLNQYLPNEEISAWVHETTGKGIIAERSMYFNYKGRTGGSNSFGTPAMSKKWYFAEGYTSSDFDSYLLVGNPGNQTANVEAYFKSPGGPYTVPLSLPPHSRQTIRVNDLPGFGSTEFTATVTSSDNPVVAERAMYFNYQGNDGGHVEHGVTELSKTWYFAEGYTAEQFDTYLLVYNPGNKATHVTVTLADSGGQTRDVPFDLDPDQRQTVKLDTVPGFEAAQVATKVTATEPVIAERAMYFNYRGLTGGSDSIGATGLDTEWYLAEGYTAEEFDTYVLLYNPGTKAATVDVAFLTSAGRVEHRGYTVEAKSRLTIPTDDILPGDSFSTTIKSTNGVGIFAERAMYFDFRGMTDGHASGAVAGSSSDWYFGEGYTGN